MDGRALRKLVRDYDIRTDVNIFSLQEKTKHVILITVYSDWRTEALWGSAACLKLHYFSKGFLAVILSANSIRCLNLIPVYCVHSV